MFGRSERIISRILGPQTYEAGISVLQLGRRDWNAPYALSDRLRAWRHGFFADSYAVYNFPRNNPADYISDFVRIARCSQVNADLMYFEHKITFRAFLLQAGLRQPDTLALAAYGNCLLNPLSSDARYIDAAEFESTLKADGGQFVVKPEAGCRGHGIFLLDARGGELFRRRGKERERFKVSDLPSIAIVERRFEQHPFWGALFPDTANSIRVLTGWAPGDRRPSSIRAVQRIGNAATVPTDNWRGGGISAIVDLKTGRLGAGRAHPLKCAYADQRFEVHPDTGAQIQDTILPYWDCILDTVMRACMSSPMHRYVGWDVLVDRNGEPVILEGNANSGVQVFQVHGGLLCEPAARRFYERCGVLK